MLHPWRRGKKCKKKMFVVKSNQCMFIKERLSSYEVHTLLTMASSAILEKARGKNYHALPNLARSSVQAAMFAPKHRKPKNEKLTCS